MTRSKGFVSLLCVLVLSGAATTSAQEQQIQKADLPDAVKKTAAEQIKGATVRGYTQDTVGGKTEYEVQMAVDGHTKDVSMDPNGNVVGVEEEVALGKLPYKVRDGLQKKARNGKITKVESISKHGKLVAYEAQLLTGGKRSEIQVGPDGETLDHEE